MFDFEKAKKLIRETGLRRRFIADQIEITHGSLNVYLCGAARPSLDVVNGLAKVLRVPVSELLAPPKAKSA